MSESPNDYGESPNEGYSNKYYKPPSSNSWRAPASSGESPDDDGESPSISNNRNRNKYR